MENATVRRSSRRTPAVRKLAIALVLLGCVGERPSPISEDRPFIQHSTGRVVFEHPAFDPFSMTPRNENVHLSYAGGTPAGNPYASVYYPEEPRGWLLTEVRNNHDGNGWFVAIRPVASGALEPGEYVALVDVAWAGAANSPVRIETTLVVRPHPRLWQPGEPLTFPRTSGHTTTALNDGGAVVVGGEPSANVIERFSPATGRWYHVATLSLGRTDHTATLLQSGAVFVAGGRRVDDDSQPPEGTWEIYDPVLGTVTSGYLNAPRYDHAAVLLADGRVLLVGGFDDQHQPTRIAEIFDPRGPRSEVVGELQGNPLPPTAAALLGDGRVLVTTGSLDGAEVGAELFDPETRLWSVVEAPRLTSRREHALVGLQDGRAVLVGGIADPARQANLSTDVFDPKTEQWTQAGLLGAPHTHVRDAAVLLPGGQVLVAGGGSFTGQGPATSAVEAFEPSPSGGAWSTAGALSYPRAGHTVTVLRDGRLLAVGGLPEGRPELWREPSP